MKNKNYEYFLIVSVVFFILLAIGLFIYIGSGKEKSASSPTEKTKSVDRTQNKINDEKQGENELSEKENEQIEALQVEQIVPTPSTGIQTETDVVNYIESMQNEVLNTEAEANTSTWKEKSKKLFITVTDFIFYGGKIGGYTFDQLSDSAKTKVITFATNIDNTIESHYPSYKETLKSKGKALYQTTTTKLKEYKTKYFEDVKEFVGEETYQQAGDTYQKVKDKAKDVTEKTVEKGKEVYEAGKEKAKEATGKAKDKISNWYQNWKEKNS